MTQNAATRPLHKIITRLGINTPERGAYFSANEVKSWPAHELTELEKLALITESSHRKSNVTCKACERLCMMPVTVYPPNDQGKAYAFVTCTEDDGGRIEVDCDDLIQWYSSIEKFAALLPQLIQTKSAPEALICENRQWYLGVIKGKKGYVPIVLAIKQTYGLVLLVGAQLATLKEVLSLSKKGLSIDNTFIRSMADESREHESPDDRARRVGKRKAELDKLGIKGVRAILAEEEGVHPSMIQKVLALYKKLTDGKSIKKPKAVNSIFDRGNK